MSSECARIAVVTGAAGALGSAVARELWSRGYGIALVDTPHATTRLDQLANELMANTGDNAARMHSTRELGGSTDADAGPGYGNAKAHGYAVDLASPEPGDGWGDLGSRIEKDLGPPTHAVLVAGGWRGGKPFHAETDDTVWHAMMSANLDTVHRSLRVLLPGMVARGQGSIVVIGSRNVERPWTGISAAAYTTSKAAVVALAQTIAAEVKESGVRINAVLPSTLDTEANRRAMPKADPAKWVALASAAKVIAFLLSEDARDVSGASVPLYGRA